MPANTSPIFPGIPVSTSIAISTTANTSRAVSVGVPTNGALFSPNTNTNGVRVDKIILNGAGTTIAGQVCIWLYDGTNAYVIDEMTITAVTPNTTTTPTFTASKIYSDFVLAPNCKLYATSQVTSQVATIGMIGGTY